MRLLVFGQTGQLAVELQRLAAREGLDLTALGRDRADLARPGDCAALIRPGVADAVINAAAYTAVDQAEADAATAQAVNAGAPAAMARAAAEAGIPFLHVSTDYVFDGSGDRPWREDDRVAPLGVYGATKLEGERLVAAASGPHVILRTAWVFSAHGKNFVRTMLRLAETRDEVSVVADQRGGPTPAADIARALVTMAGAMAAGRGPSGIYHFAGQPHVTWADFAEAIFATAALPRRPAVRRIATADYPTPARRPANSMLDCTKIGADYGIAPPDWRQGLAAVLKELETSA